MPTRKLAGWAASSSNPVEVSNRVRGIVLTLSSVIILIAAQFFQVTLSANDIVQLATTLGTVAGAVWTIYGFGLAAVRFFATPRV